MLYKLLCSSKLHFITKTLQKVTTHNKMEKKITASQGGKKQIVACRITEKQATQFERKCLENRLPMSRILQEAVLRYLKN
jgi:hypothetical protein